MQRPPTAPCRTAIVLTLLLTSVSARGAGEADPLARLEWRNVGPVNMSGRVADVEGIAGDPRIVYVGTASGGIWKTTDGGASFAPIFDGQPVASIGDLALAPSNPEVIYAGTGEGNVRNSVSFGNGVYRSLDGGATWSHIGLEKTRHIARIAVHPQDPDTAFVAAIGNIYAPSTERGVFRTRDGGKSWEKVLYLDDRHGAADLDLDPQNPNVVFAALWRFERKPWTIASGSEEGGVWRSLDGGTTWAKLGKGLPKLMGRIGVKVAPSNPRVVYVIAESHQGTLFRSEDRGETFEKVSEDVKIVARGFYYTDLRVDPRDENTVYPVASLLFRSIDGGKSFERISAKTHIDFHSLWIDPQNPRRMWQGQDGGVAVSYDGGERWEPLRNLPIGQFYQVFYDARQPFYYLGGGLQDNGTWYGPSRSREGAGILPDDWRMMSFGDAYWVVPHPEELDLFLSESQAGNIVRTDMKTGRQIDASPQPRRGDGGPASELEYRFNWNAPIVASPHDPKTVYFGANVVWKTTDFGTSWQKISPDLTTDDPEKQKTAGGPAWEENTTAEYHCTIISLAESPVEPGVLWAGTDDGNLQVSRDGGGSWNNVVAAVPELPAFSPVSHVEPSRTAGATAYATFDRHMFDDFRPHLFKTTDYGASWARLGSEGLPAEGWVWVVREDPKNPHLLYAGTEVGLYASYDGGGRWQKLHLKNFPPVAVHDLLIHPRENDLIVGTHGRAIWVFDDATPLQQWNATIAEKPAHLFPVRPAFHFPTLFTRYGLGDQIWLAPNPPDGALLTFYLKDKLAPEEGLAEDERKKAEAAAREKLKIEVLDGAGKVIRTLEKLPLEAGLLRIAWDLRYDPPAKRSDEEKPPGEFGQPPRGPRVLPGTYTVRLTLDGAAQEQRVEVGIDPTVAVSPRELEAQFQVGRRLTDLRGQVNERLRALDTIKSQLEARRKEAKQLKKELPAALEEKWKAVDEALAGCYDRLIRDEKKPFWSVGPRVSERLGDLFDNVDGGFGAPTPAQLDYLRALEGETATALGEVDRFLAEQIPALDAELRAAGVAGLVFVP